MIFSEINMTEEKAELVSKVPQVTFLFWIVKILATTLGETAGDAVTMSWLGETTPGAKGTGYLIGTGIFGVIFIVAVLVQIRAKKFHPFLYWLTIVATNRRHNAGRLLHAIARHWLYRRFNHLAYLCDCVASDLALVDREHIDRNGEHAEGRNFLLGDNHVLPDFGDGAWRLGGRHK
jgi:Repeat of Unknown Function (DUF347)